MTTRTADEMVAQQVAAIKDHMTATMNPMREEIERMKASLAQSLAAQREIRRAALARHQSNDRPRVLAGRYQGMDALDLAIVRSLLTAAQRNPDGLKQETRHQLPDWAKALTAAQRDLVTAALDSTTTNAGDELVPTGEARDLWMDVNLETAIASLFPRVDMPTNPFEIPLQLGDVNWYPGTENIAGTGTTVNTEKQILTAHELVANIPWSLTLEEDSIIAMMDEVRSSLVRNAREVIDDVLLNADTTPANNINADGATIATTTAGKAHWLLGFDGLRHLPLVDNTAQRNDHNAAVSDDMFNEIRAKLGKYGVRPSECAWITDLYTFIRAQSISNMRTLDVLGPRATILTGQLGSVEGIPLIVSEQMRLADTDGKVTSAGNVTNTGSLLIVNRSQWRVGYRRDISIESERDIQKRQTIMVISMRLAFMERTRSRSTATHTAMQYDITGVA
jgi:HK97 family phage major capsid protein